ncbi:hypothetical protein C1645_736723 [Glomus cerebriforme]|uniref:RING-CH-type domain-containing protein n=1 Tax=Glomus cerebriforme TaxID=658196 RepID=A0A397T0W6_9GLOM|nr:hypothetical protein C1645_736723 [Glomus cerebriforme]
MIPLSQSNNTYPTCRICLSSDEPKSFIAPCKCKGTVKYVHRTCLTQWRKRLVSYDLNGRPQELDICTLCKFRYIVKQKSKFGNAVTRPGLFFLGSTSNIVTVYFIMDDLLDLLHHHHQRQLHGTFGNQSKKFILWGSCIMITGIWFHYSLSSFKISNQEELPLWILRWVTISMAVFDFGLRRIFWKLDKNERKFIEFYLTRE